MGGLRPDTPRQAGSRLAPFFDSMIGPAWRIVSNCGPVAPWFLRVWRLPGDGVERSSCRVLPGVPGGVIGFRAGALRRERLAQIGIRRLGFAELVVGGVPVAWFSSTYHEQFGADFRRPSWTGLGARWRNARRAHRAGGPGEGDNGPGAREELGVFRRARAECHKAQTGPGWNRERHPGTGPRID